MGTRTTAQATLLRAVHGQQGVTRAALAQELGMPSGFAAETVARLVAARLLSEEPAPPTGSRGRPTTLLRAHPGGPLAAVAAITQETWTVAVTELGCLRCFLLRLMQRDRMLVSRGSAAVGFLEGSGWSGAHWEPGRPGWPGTGSSG